MNENNPSIVEYFGGDTNGHSCGYCKGSNSSKSHGKFRFGMWAHSLDVQDYENLINRGWRRSGHYCYKPMMKETCCPLYTIRCDAANFQLNHSHKKVLKKVNKFLLQGGKVNKNQSIAGTSSSSSKSEDCAPAREEMAPQGSQDRKANLSEVTVERREGENWKVPQKKAKLLRLERKIQKTGSLDQKTTNQQTPSKTIEEFLVEEKSSATPAHRLEIKLVNTSADEFKETLNESAKLYAKYQMSVHKDSEDECTVEQFKRFLVKSPLQNSYDDGDLPTGYGSFHQQYYLDGKLIAVGVIDLLPSCLSSVYLFYDPDYSFLSLGTYAALREIAFVRQLTKTNPEFSWYYLGFYIHSCPKMVYKGQYRPSYLVCPETYTWQPISQCIPKLDQSKYSRLSDDTDGDSSQQSVNDSQLSEVGILHKRRAMPYAAYAMLGRKSNSADVKVVKEYASLVGIETARRMLLYRP
uniref:Arginyl-tRNA--protein transferase 1 n=1 Tax=Alona affinis TaxID=381656 RepID=A0A9N6WQN2_9CRUS|nr:EOG090X06AF [Alona affinis]